MASGCLEICHLTNGWKLQASDRKSKRVVRCMCSHDWCGWISIFACSSADETTAELSFLWSGVRSQFLLFTAAHPAVCVCAIKKLNRNRRQYFFPFSAVVILLWVMRCQRRKNESQSKQRRYQRGCHEKIIYYARERVRARWQQTEKRSTRRIIEIWGK